MMIKSRILRSIVFAGIIGLVFSGGCAQQSSYKINTQVRWSIKWQGPVPDKAAFDESFNDQRVEMIVNERMQGRDAKGVEVAKVTIDSLKYFSIIKNNTMVDFDSSRKTDVDNPLSKLIGQSYTIAYGPDNNINSVTGLESGRSLLNGNSSSDRAGQGLLTPDEITKLQATLVLPKTGAKELKSQDKWSRIKTFSFGLMGLKSYEKKYSVKEIRDVKGRKIAVIDMSSIPSSEIEEKYRGQQQRADFLKMFDTKETYTGSGEVDLKTGGIESYRENLQASWVAALPAGKQADANEPVVLMMTANHDYEIQRIK